MICQQCKAEFKAKRISSKYCSNKCKLAYHRSKKVIVSSDKVSVSRDSVSYTILKDKKVYKRQAVRYKDDKYGSRPMPDHKEDIPDKQNRCIYQRTDKTLYIVDATGISINFQDNPLRDNTPQDLYDAINGYEADTWKESNEFKELMRRLKSMNIVALDKQGYKIPNWKYKEGYKQLIKARRGEARGGVFKKSVYRFHPSTHPKI